LKAVGGDSALGGDDFDRAIAQLLLDEMGTEREFRVSCGKRSTPRCAAEEALTTGTASKWRSRFRRTLTRRELDAAIRP